MGVIQNVTRRAEVPFEPGKFFAFRMLSWISLDVARQARIEAIAKQARVFSGLRELLPPRTDGAGDAEADRLQSYDRLTLLKLGVATWPYDGDVDVEQLDEQTAEWAARQILDLSVPTGDDVKKGSSPSTVT